MIPGRRLLRAAALTGLAVAVAGGAATIVQSAADVRDRRRHPAPGRLFDVGGHRLHAVIEGDADDPPAIVFEAGLGGDHRAWRRVRERLGPVRTVAYDRAGSGWSDPGPRPRTASSMAGELHRLLDATTVRPPYLLVAHSFGAMVARLFASIYPAEVCGLVLVDPSHEDQRRFWEPTRLGALLGRVRRSRYRIRPVLARVGWFRLRRRGDGGDPVEGWLASRSTAWDWVREAALIPTSEEQVRRSAPLPDVPLVVLRAHVLHEDETWIRLGAEIARSVPGGRLVVVEETGHSIQSDRPEAVVEAIRTVLRA